MTPTVKTSGKGGREPTEQKILTDIKNYDGRIAKTKLIPDCYIKKCIKYSHKKDFYEWIILEEHSRRQRTVVQVNGVAAYL